MSTTTMTQTTTTALYTIVHAGTARGYSLPERGQLYPSLTAARAALTAWRRREPMAGTAEAAHAIGLRGPFQTALEAGESDVSETTEETIARVARTHA